jgi:hypothetical protein
MAYNKAPTATFPTYAYASSAISINKSDLPDLTDAEGHATTGDTRRIAYGFLEQLYQHQQASDPADLSTKMNVTRTKKLVAGNVQYTYSVALTMASADDVATE